MRSSVCNVTGSNLPKTVYKIQRIHDLYAGAIAVKLRIRATPFSQLTAKPNRNDRILTINCQVTISTLFWVRVARSAMRVWKLWTGRPSVVRPVV